MKPFVRRLVSQFVQRWRCHYYRVLGYDIHITTGIERRVNLDRVNPRGIHIGKNTVIASQVTVLSHHFPPKGDIGHVDTYIGENCIVGIGAIILAGTRIGNNVVVGAGSVVTRDFPSNVVIAGNPARVIKTNIRKV